MSRLIFLWIAVAACAACSASTSGDAHAPDLGTSGGIDFGMRAVVVCGGVECATGQECCYATHTCVDPTTGSCVSSGLDGGTGPGRVNPRRDEPAPPCASDRDCRDDEFCGATTCGAVGFCYARDNCGTCFNGSPDDPTAPPTDPPPGTDCQVCGCDGVTYPSPQAACRAGARINLDVGLSTACEVPSGLGTPPRVGCGRDTDCPSGQTCCSYYGVCVDPACPYCCDSPPPEGASFPCTTNGECGISEYCGGTGCGTPGWCVRSVSMFDCNGVVDEVCGCDGHTYTNECWALSAQTRVASTGSCRDAG